MKRPDFSWDKCTSPAPIPPDLHWKHSPLVVDALVPVGSTLPGVRMHEHGRVHSALQTDDAGGPDFYIITTVCVGCGRFYTRTEDA